jgi:hypothetical protein
MGINASWVVTGNVTTNASTGMAQPITSAANDFTGAGANNALVFTAGASGSLVKRLRFKAAGTNVATVARIFVNNGSANTTAANNCYLDDLQLSASTSSATAPTGSTFDYVFPDGGLLLENGFRIYVGLATAVSAGWVVTPIAGDL